MKGCKRFFMTLAIGAFVAFPGSTALVSAGERGESASGSGTAVQAKSGDEQGGAQYTYRNAWNHRNETQSRYGNEGQDARYARGGGFVDENGDGINDLAPDHDGDGIPNGQDPDWVKNKQDGTGYQHGKQMTEGGKGCDRSQVRGRKGGQAAR